MTVTLINNPNVLTSCLRWKQISFNNKVPAQQKSEKEGDVFVSGNPSGSEEKDNNNSNKGLLYAGIGLFLLMFAGILIQKRIDKKAEKEFDDVLINAID